MQGKKKKQVRSSVPWMTSSEADELYRLAMSARETLSELMGTDIIDPEHPMFGRVNMDAHCLERFRLCIEKKRAA